MNRRTKDVLKRVYLGCGVDRAVGMLCRHGFRTDRRKVVFSSFWGRGFADNPKYVALELMKRGLDLDLVWLAANPDAVRRTLPPGIRVGAYKGWAGLREASTAAVRVDNQLVNLHDVGFMKRPDQLYVQTWHGSLGIKRIGFDFADGTADHDRRYRNRVKDGAMVDALISNSTFESAIYREQWLGGGKILEYGHPRNDILVNGVAPEFAAEIRRRIGVAENERILLYAPTFRDDDPTFDYAFDYATVLSACEKRFGGTWRMVVRKHPRMSSAMLGVTPGAGVVDASSYPDMQELLAVTDALVTDYSSCMFDFLLTGRPVFVFARDLEKYETTRGFYYPFSETPFSVARDARQLAEGVKAFDEETYRRDRATFLAARGCVEDGHASERVVDLIVDFLNHGNQD